MGVHVSSIVNGVIRTVSNQFIYLFIYYLLIFCEKVSRVQKRKSNQNQPRK